MKIAIIGCGYVGGAAAAFWKGQGHQVTVTTRNPGRIEQLEPLSNRVVLIHQGDLRQVLEGQDALLISVAPVKGETYEDTYLSTVEAIIGQIDKTTKQVIYISSTSVYGDHGGTLVDETTPPQPSGADSAILLEAEQRLRSAACSSICLLRLGEILGKGRSLADRIHKIGSTPLPGTGASRVNLSFLDDIVKGIDFALQNRLDGIYNLCSDLHIPRRDLYKHICEQHHLPAVQWDPSRTSAHAGNKIVSSAKIQEEGFCFGPIAF